MKTRFTVLFLLLAASLTAQPVPVPQVTAAVSQGVLEVVFAIPTGLHQSLQPDYFGVDVAPASLPAGVTAAAAVFPPTETRILDLPSYEGSVVVRIPLSGSGSESFVLSGTARWQLCYDDGVCLLPSRAGLTLEVRQTAGLGYQARAVVLDTAPQAPALGSAFDLGGAEETVVPPGAPETPLFLVLFFAFLGGVLLNFMPCVLPVLSIKAVSLVKQAGSNRGVRWAHAWAASGGILSSLLVLASVLIGLQAAGAAVGWGVQFQNPWYVVGLIVLVLVFALSLFDVFLLSSPAVRQGKRTGLVGSFFSGLLTVVLATPCTAPFLGTALGVAFASPWWVILLVFIFVGVGLALPFFLVTVIPGALELLPKPGPWMDVFKGAMGFALVGTAVWLLTVLLAQTTAAEFSAVLWFLGLLVLAGWLFGLLQRGAWDGWKRKAAGVSLAVLIGLGGASLLSFHPTGTEGAAAAAGASLPAPWKPFSEAAVADLTAAGRPVFVDFTAEWCLTCKINENGPLADSAVLDAFRDADVTLVRGDYTNADPVIASWLKRHGRAGVPFYALLVPGKDPVILSEVLTKEGLIQALSPLL